MGFSYKKASIALKEKTRFLILYPNIIVFTNPPFQHKPLNLLKITSTCICYICLRHTSTLLTKRRKHTICKHSCQVSPTVGRLTCSNRDEIKFCFLLHRPVLQGQVLMGRSKLKKSSPSRKYLYLNENGCD